MDKFNALVFALPSVPVEPKQSLSQKKKKKKIDDPRIPVRDSRDQKFYSNINTVTFYSSIHLFFIN